MAVIAGKPFWYQRDATSSWVKLDQVSEYENYNAADRDKQRDDFVENLITYSHVLSFGNHLIRVHVGTDDGNVGIEYDFDSDMDVRAAIRLPGYSDFPGILDALGYSENSTVTQTAIAELQLFVDNAREND